MIVPCNVRLRNWGAGPRDWARGQGPGAPGPGAGQKFAEAIDELP